MASNHDPFGLLAFLHWNHDWNNFHFPERDLDRAIDQIAELGVSFLRLDILWSDVYAPGKPFDFTRYDRILERVAKRRINVLAMLQYNKLKDGPNGPLWNRPPDSDDEFADYVEQTVRRYRNAIRHWEIWNEPNHPVYWAAPRDGMARYTRLLKAAYAGARRGDPDCVVLNGGITEPVIEDVRNLYAHGGGKACDVLAIHMFIDPLAPDRDRRFEEILTGVRNLMEENGDGHKKIWLTEIGCPGLPPGVEPRRWFGGECLSEAQQAEWVEQLYGMQRRFPWLEKVFWAFYRDTRGMFEDSAEYLGLVRFDFTPKPSFARMKSVITAYRSASPQR